MRWRAGLASEASLWRRTALRPPLVLSESPRASLTPLGELPVPRTCGQVNLPFDSEGPTIGSRAGPLGAPLLTAATFMRSLTEVRDDVSIVQVCCPTPTMGPTLEARVRTREQKRSKARCRPLVIGLHQYAIGRTWGENI